MIIRSSFVNLLMFLLLFYCTRISLASTSTVGVSSKVLQKLKDVLTNRECYFFIEYFIEESSLEDREKAYKNFDYNVWPDSLDCPSALDMWSRDIFPPLIESVPEEKRQIKAAALLDSALRYAALTDTDMIEWQKLHPEILTRMDGSPRSHQFADLGSRTSDEKEDMGKLQHPQQTVLGQFETKDHNSQVSSEKHDKEKSNQFGEFEIQDQNLDSAHPVPSHSPLHYYPEPLNPELGGGYDYAGVGANSLSFPSKSEEEYLTHEKYGHLDHYDLNKELIHPDPTNYYLSDEDIEAVFQEKAREEQEMNLAVEAQAIHQMKIVQESAPSSSVILRSDLIITLVLLLYLDT